jgi:hypothetical protein
VNWVSLSPRVIGALRQARADWRYEAAQTSSGLDRLITAIRGIAASLRAMTWATWHDIRTLDTRHWPVGIALAYLALAAAPVLAFAELWPSSEGIVSASFLITVALAAPAVVFVTICTADGRAMSPVVPISALCLLCSAVAFTAAATATTAKMTTSILPYVLLVLHTIANGLLADRIRIDPRRDRWVLMMAAGALAVVLGGAAQFWWTNMRAASMPYMALVAARPAMYWQLALAMPLTTVRFAFGAGAVNTLPLMQMTLWSLFVWRHRCLKSTGEAVDKRQSSRLA